MKKSAYPRPRRLAMTLSAVSAFAVTGGTKVTCTKFGETADGKIVRAYTLVNTHGLSAKILDFGGVIYEMNVPDKDGVFANIPATCRRSPNMKSFVPISDL